MSNGASAVETEQMISVVYLSTAVKLFNDQELIGLLKECRENNARAGVTGMLLYRDGNFIQVLEGPEAVVTELQEHIAHDPRHKDMQVLITERISERRFADWSMGFCNVEQLSEDVQDSFCNFLREDRALDERVAERAGFARRMLALFRESVR